MWPHVTIISGSSILHELSVLFFYYNVFLYSEIDTQFLVTRLDNTYEISDKTIDQQNIIKTLKARIIQLTLTNDFSFCTITKSILVIGIGIYILHISSLVSQVSRTTVVKIHVFTRWNSDRGASNVDLILKLDMLKLLRTVVILYNSYLIELVLRNISLIQSITIRKNLIMSIVVTTNLVRYVDMRPDWGINMLVITCGRLPKHSTRYFGFHFLSERNKHNI